jgi:hypothetical protein
MSGDGVDQPDRVACENCRGRRQLCEESLHVEAGQIGQLRRQQGGIGPGQIDPHRLIERTARAPAHGVEDRGSWRCSWSFNGAVQKMSALLRLLTAAFGTHRPFNDVRSYVGSRG